jgi:hypothetical protein
MRHELGQRRLGLGAQLVHQGPTPLARDQHFARAGQPMIERILARLIDVESVVCVLQCRDAAAARDQDREQLYEQRRLAAAAPAREADEPHG